MRIIQLLVTLKRGDAIGNFTLELQDILVKEGYDSLVFAYNIEENLLADKVRYMTHFKGGSKDDLIIYHMCEGHKINEVIRTLRCRKVAIYHNITPCGFFSSYGKQYYQIQKNALNVIKSMKNEFCYCIADSEFNKQDLIDMGYNKERIDVLPLIINTRDYEQTPDLETFKRYNDEYVNILFVGRVVPNKRQEDIIRIFAYYHYKINRKSRLFIIGSPFVDDYFTALQDYISYLGITDCVIMPGHSKFKEILAYYRCADVFLCMSEHEGFCVPLLEAMLFDVPIIAYRSSAIPYTLNDGGVLVDDKEPDEIAKVIDRVVSDKNYADNILRKQHRRLEDFEPDRIKQLYLKEITKILGEKR